MLIGMISVFFLAAPLNCAYGATESHSPAVDFLQSKLDAYSRELALLRPSTAGCRAAYSKLYTTDTLTISVFFGFIDSRDTTLVLDGPFERAVIRHLTKDCPRNYDACGFTIARADSSILNKIVLTKSGSKTGISISLLNSSVSEDYSACVTRLAGEQKVKSQMVTDEYLTALSRDDVVLYAGHSRYGTGPGFRPLPSFSTAGVAMFLQRPLLSRMIDTLKNSVRQPALIGILSCRSREYYAGRIHSAAPSSALLVTSGITTHENDVLGLLGALNSVLGTRCYDDVNTGINANKKSPDVHLYGLFDQSPHPRYTRHNNLLHVFAAIFFMPVLVILVSKWTKAARVSPLRPASDLRSGAILLVLSIYPCLITAMLFHCPTAFALPVFLSLMGFFLLSAAVYRRKIPLGSLNELARYALPFLVSSLIVFFCMSLMSEPGADTALSSLRQSLKFFLVFYLILPFVLFSEEILLVPYLDKNSPVSIPSMIFSLLFYFIVWAALWVLNPGFKPMLWPLALLVIYKQILSSPLYRYDRNVLVPVVFQTLTFTWIFTEEIHGLMYA